MKKIPTTSFLIAMVGLDCTALHALEFELEDSPHLEGAQLVVNNVPPMTIPWMSVAFMTMASLVACVVEGSIVAHRHARFWVWNVGLVSHRRTMWTTPFALDRTLHPVGLSLRRLPLPRIRAFCYMANSSGMRSGIPAFNS
jgi:hypothetical protein